MKNIDNHIIEIICKYPFLTDPIVLFIPEQIPTKQSLKEQSFDFVYPIIYQLQGEIPELENDIAELLEEAKSSPYDSEFIKNEYIERIKDFQKIVHIIRDFYDEDESQKYTLLNQYFGIDVPFIQSIFTKQATLTNYFICSEPLLSQESIQKLENTIIDAPQIQKYFQKAIEFLGLEKNWNVILGDTISIVHTNFHKEGGDIVIPKGKQISVKKLLELIIHEIDGHCVQFSDATGLYSGSIRFSQSESLLEGYALLLEYTLAGKYFGELKVPSLIAKKEIHYNYITQQISLQELIDTYEGNIFRVFRGFRDIENYTNLKDMVYLQGISINLEYLNTYENFEELIQKGCVNERYFQKYGIAKPQKRNLDIAKTSAVYILNTYFI